MIPLFATTLTIFPVIRILKVWTKSGVEAKRKFTRHVLHATYNHTYILIYTPWQHFCSVCLLYYYLAHY